MKFSSHYPFHFIIFSVFPVLSIYSFNIRIININEIFFPIIVILISSTLFWIFLSKILKNSFKAGIITTLGLFLFFTYGHIQKFLVGISFGEIDVGRPLFLSIIYVVFFVLGTILISKTKVNLKNVNIILNTTTFTMILIPLILIIPYSINTLDYSEIENDELVNLDDISTEFPDVYYILMDGYTSSSILKQQYGFDNSDFVNFLKKNEFHVPNS